MFNNVLSEMHGEDVKSFSYSTAGEFNQSNLSKIVEFAEGSQLELIPVENLETHLKSFDEKVDGSMLHVTLSGEVVEVLKVKSIKETVEQLKTSDFISIAMRPEFVECARL